MSAVPARHARHAFALAALVVCGACAHSGGGPRNVTVSQAPSADSITIGLWHFDESGGTTCADTGPSQLRGTAGLDTRTEFGRYANGRMFTSSLESFVFVPYDAEMNSRHLTVEAWIHPDSLAVTEDTPIAGRWSEYPNEQSWLFSLVGLQRESRFTHLRDPGFHELLVSGGQPGHLMFVYQPSDPGASRVFFSTTDVPLGRWTHVAVTHDGAVVKFWINGQLDAQFAVRSPIRDSVAPLLVGNYFDTRTLSTFSGNLSTDGHITYSPVYAFRGTIDELRVSSQARETFAE